MSQDRVSRENSKSKYFHRISLQNCLTHEAILDSTQARKVSINDIAKSRGNLKRLDNVVHAEL